ncbi:carbamoyltransferase family protein [Parasphingorhabdus pacifica]
MRVLGINSVFHDPAAALVVDGRILAAAEEERFTRRKHGKDPVPFSAWEQPVEAAKWCLRTGGITASEVDAVACSYDPGLVDEGLSGTDRNWEWLRTLYARRAPEFLKTALPGLDSSTVEFVPHHVAHAASAGLAAPYEDCAVLTVDGRGERISALAGSYRNGELDVLATQRLPHSLGLMYEELTEHLGFARSSDEYKVMALASYAKPVFSSEIAEFVRTVDDGHFEVAPIDWGRWAPARQPGGELREEHAQLASSVQARLEEVLLELAGWLHQRTGHRFLACAGGVALNCVANTRLAVEGPFEQVWVQPAAGDSGTALGGALQLASSNGDRIIPMPDADLGREWSEEDIAALLDNAALKYERPGDVGAVAAEYLAADRIVAWFQGRSEFGPRALGHRSLFAHPGHADNVERLNRVKGREQFRPVAPMVRQERAGELFSGGPLPSPYMLFVHDVDPEWQDRIPAVVHVDGTARIQTVDGGAQPGLSRMLEEFESRTGLPAVINTSFNTAGRPMVDSPVDALECFGAAPIDVLVIGPFVVRRPGSES